MKRSAAVADILGLAITLDLAYGKFQTPLAIAVLIALVAAFAIKCWQLIRYRRA